MERYIKGQLFNLLGISEYQFEQFKNSLQAREVFNKVDVDSYYKILDCHNTIPYALWVAISQMLMQHNMDPTRIAIFASHNLSPACALGQGNWN